MHYLILTRQGIDALLASDKLSGAKLSVNPGLLSPQESAELVARGAEVTVLAEAVDPWHGLPHGRPHREAGAVPDGPMWVERSAQLPELLAGEQQDGNARPLLRRALHDAGSLATRAVGHLRRFASAGEKLLLIPYLGYGNRQQLSLRGRVIEDEGFRVSAPGDSAWDNLIEMFKRLESDQVAGALVRARFRGIEQDALTDAGGYFDIEMALPEPLTTDGWHDVELELIDPSGEGERVQAVAQVLVPPASARFGVISDIDDTILWTNVTNRLNMLLTLARSNAHTRKPFKGVAAFYRALHEGASGGERNPVFYVSSSPWHLFSPLAEFLRLQDIPVGPLLLKELAIHKVLGSGRHRTHKLDRIEAILARYPQLPFILIGDSGEHDPEIYAEVVRRHPKSIKVIYIRNVNPDPARVEAIDKLIEEVRASGAQLILAPDSEFAAAHAAGEGLIRPREVGEVRAEVQAEQRDTQGAGPASGSEGTLGSQGALGAGGTKGS